MTNQITALKKLSSQINDRYRQLLDITGPERMPISQLHYFIDQAMSRHYLVEVALLGTEATMVGYLDNGPQNTLLIKHPGQAVTGFIHFSQIQFLKRV
ncbi:hypothetical protein [uncultured Secundilactobacillus sp.]|uniref:hypothetical protein n=1 Tax=uncultured Secundilactobacillus sp. TaxID=2813935 RepID=UPI00258EF0E1|nr:hypothetical protein [uncultured Secundilactobacillus sp.]